LGIHEPARRQARANGRGWRGEGDAAVLVLGGLVAILIVDFVKESRKFSGGIAPPAGAGFCLKTLNFSVNLSRLGWKRIFSPKSD
jgi:hypothetical protein